ncbi:hypothetical protein LZ318_12935 [Saccharopolyspora indica]|uniref:WXG100-like domain-containing protein n=1 Tax=Saccharopolyspora indica TaxID=1229659 RepID=UPI0022EA1AAC|nr:hypothetical protein [Saccharopolyspora indica]MDA3647200.1 hypothetical protein [Saccharopolyspora indica]
MAIPEPDSALWNDVRPLTEWPATDELIMQDLARAWGRAGSTFERAGAKPPDPHLLNGWRDGNGQRFRDKITALRNLVWDNGAEMTHLGWLAQEYGYDVGHTKTEIRKLIAANDQTYTNMNGLFGLFGDTDGRRQMVAEIAASINLFLRQMAERIAARGQGVPQPPRTVFTPRYDPVTDTPDAAVDPRTNRGLRGSREPRPWEQDGVRDKIPGEWGRGSDNRKGIGHRWSDPHNQGNGIRIDKGDPNSPSPSQRVDHVVVRHNGQVIGRDGRPISGSIKENAEQAHIPLSEWKQWWGWNAP